MQSLKLESGFQAFSSSSRLPCRRASAAGRSHRAARPLQQQRLAPAAALDSQAVTAATQQAVAFTALVGAEAAFTGLTVPATQPGRPSVIFTLGGIGGTLAAVALLQQGAATPACVLGLAAAAALGAYYVQRTKYTPYNPSDWPGAKAWPAVMCLIAFFELSVFAQELLKQL